MEQVAEKISISEIFDRCGHSLSLEAPDRMAALLIRFVHESSSL